MGISILKFFSIFSTVLIIIFIFGPVVIGTIQGIKGGNWTTTLKETGGRVFALDNNLITETNYLLEKTSQKDSDKIDITFHFVYSLTIIFLFFFVGMLAYKLGNWLSGKAQFNPLVDVFIVIVIIGFFLSIEFLYSNLILGVKVYPLQGVWSFLKNLPIIIKNLFY